MVYQIHSDVIDFKVCSISFQRPSAKFLSRRPKISNTIYDKSKMENNVERHPLPVVELRPFSKKVWRREKSLPDFYEKKKSEESNAPSKEKEVEPIPAPSRLIRDLTETRRNLESRQNTFDSAIAKYRNHPKAEFLHESNKAWRKQDLIPSFITRFERTKTSLESISRENTYNRINLEKPSLYENTLKREPNPSIRISGGRMNQQIHRRHLLYLNPLDTYRQPNAWVPHFNSTNSIKQNTSRDKYFTARHSFPLASSKSRDLILGESHVHYPLKPIRREDAESAHKFNNKLGAAKNSLEVLSKIGVPTKLEKKLEKEMEINLEKFRKDRLLLSSDLKGVPFHYLHFESNMTVGEMSLRNAREANKPARGKHRQVLGRKTDVLLGHISYRGSYDLFDTGISTPQLLNGSNVDTIRHVISSQPLVEETETRSIVDSSVKGPVKSEMDIRDLNGQITGNERIISDSAGITTGYRDGEHEVTSNQVGKGKSDPRNEEIVSSGNKDQTEIHEAGKNRNTTGISEENNNEKSSTDQPQIVDSSRIETNVAYIENLQLKSSLGYVSNANSPNFGPAEKSLETNMDPTRHQSQPDNGNQEMLPSSPQSHYTTSQHPASPSHPVPITSPHSMPLSPVSQPVNTAQGYASPVPAEVGGSAVEQSRPSSYKYKPNDPSSVANETPLPSSSKSGKEAHTPCLETDTDNPILETPESAIAGERLDTVDYSAGDVFVQGMSTAKPGVELKNPSPLTSSGIESLPTTDQEDEVVPSSADHSTREKVDGNISQDHVDMVLGNETLISSDTTDSRLHASHPSPLNNEQEQDQEMEIDNNCVEQNNNLIFDRNGAIDEIESKHKVINKKDTQQVTAHTRDDDRIMQDSPAEDEGISMIPSETAVLDSSVVEDNSELAVKTITSCADNGDSGVSTTFLTSEESAPEVLESIRNS